MRIQHVLAPLALIACVAGLASALAPQDKPRPAQERPKAGAPAGAPVDAKADMAKMAAFGKPGPEHKVLDARVGTWNGKVKGWMQGPDAPPVESTCTTEYRWIYGGRYLQGSTKGTFMGEPFEGTSTSGYDTMKRKYVMSWIDSMATAICVHEGGYDAASKTFTYAGQSPDPMAGRYVETKTIEREVDPSTFVMETWSTDPGTGQPKKCMEITFTRAK